MMLMSRIVLQIVSHLSMKKKGVGKTPETTPQPGKPKPQLPQPPIPSINVDVTISIKYLSNFWKSPDFPWMNLEVELALSWENNCSLTEHHNNITGVKFTTT